MVPLGDGLFSLILRNYHAKLTFNRLCHKDEVIGIILWNYLIVTLYPTFFQALSKTPKQQQNEDRKQYQVHLCFRMDLSLKYLSITSRSLPI